MDIQEWQTVGLGFALARALSRMNFLQLAGPIMNENWKHDVDVSEMPGTECQRQDGFDLQASEHLVQDPAFNIETQR